MLADHWGFVIGAYGLAAIVFLAYWRRLVQRERTLTGAEPKLRARRGRP